MASDNECPTSSWDKDAPAFYVESLNESDFFKNSKEIFEGIRQKFSKKHHYFLGSDECCGCGFIQEVDINFLDFSEAARKAANHQALHKYLVECLKSEPILELYGCWAGSEDEEIESRSEIHVDKILEGFYFVEDQLVVVRR